METFVLILQLLAVPLFLFLIWPHLKAENWKEKFIKNKDALALIIVLVAIFIFMQLMVWAFDALAPEMLP